MNSALVHEALVAACLPSGRLVVRLHPSVSDGCAGCALVGSCGPKGRRGDEIELEAEWTGAGRVPSPGERVLVSPARGGTARAATLLMTLPLAGMLCAGLLAAGAGASDGLAAACALAGAVAGFVPALASGRRNGRLRWQATECVESIIESDI